jgi:hypothetical protein
MIKCNHATTRGAHMFADCLLRKQFCEWLHQSCRRAALHNVLWTDEACLTSEGVLNVHNSHLLARDNPHATRECSYQVRFSVWVSIVGDIIVGSYLLPGRLTVQWFRDFLETVLPGLFDDVSSREAEVTVSAWRRSSALLGRYPRSWTGRGGPIVWRPSYAIWIQIPWNFDYGGTWRSTFTQSGRSRRLANDYQRSDIVAILQAPVTTLDANIFRRVGQNDVRHTAVCLEGRFEKRIVITRHPWFHHLTACAI